MICCGLVSSRSANSFQSEASNCRPQSLKIVKGTPKSGPFGHGPFQPFQMVVRREGLVNACGDEYLLVRYKRLVGP